MKPAGLLLHPTPYLERRRPGEPWASPAPSVLSAAVTASWAKLGAEEQERPSEGSWVPPPSAVFPLYHLSLLSLLKFTAFHHAGVLEENSYHIQGFSLEVP